MTVTWDELVAMLDQRTRRRLGPNALVASWHGREIVVSRSRLGDVELATLEIFLCRHEGTAPFDLVTSGGELPLGAPVLVGDRWILRASAPLGGTSAHAWDVMARALATCAHVLVAPAPPPSAAVELFSYLA